MADNMKIEYVVTWKDRYDCSFAEVLNSEELARVIIKHLQDYGQNTLIDLIKRVHRAKDTHITFED